MGDVGDDFNAVRQTMTERKARLGVPCANCKAKLPKAQPKVLLPGQRCWCGYRDPRPNQSKEFWKVQP
jgi:hypothetical protein